MNALATDQAETSGKSYTRRWKTKWIFLVTAGLFIGEGKKTRKEFPKNMGGDHIIESRDEIVNPPTSY
jgi:hypothetical protein